MLSWGFLSNNWYLEPVQFIDSAVPVYTDISLGAFDVLE
jgi:hypothetical protein